MIDACREPIDRPHDFKFCPKKTEDIEEFDQVSDKNSLTCGKGLISAFSIKNNCKTPYCSKLVTDWSSFGFEQDFTTLAYVSIHKDLFDPIVDPDLVDFSVTK